MPITWSAITRLEQGEGYPQPQCHNKGKLTQDHRKKGGGKTEKSQMPEGTTHGLKKEAKNNVQHPTQCGKEITTFIMQYTHTLF